MKTINVNEASGAALDWLVAKAQGWVNYPSDSKERGTLWHLEPDKAPFGLTCPGATWKPSTDWSQGGPIIERELIDLAHYKQPQKDGRREVVWRATMFPEFKFQNYSSAMQEFSYIGPTPLIAACRCYVASKLGDEVEVPEELP